MNRIKTTFLLPCLTLLLVAMGSAIGGRSGALFAFVVAAVLNFITYWYSDKIVLRASLDWRDRPSGPASAFRRLPERER